MEGFIVWTLSALIEAVARCVLQKSLFQQSRRPRTQVFLVNLLKFLKWAIHYYINSLWFIFCIKLVWCGMSLSNLIRFSFFNIESDEEEIVLNTAVIHLLKTKEITAIITKKISQKKISIGKTLATYNISHKLLRTSQFQKTNSNNICKLAV